MKNKLLTLLAVAAIFLPGYRARAAQTNSAAADTNTIAAEWKVLFAKINTSLQEGKRSEADQADNLKAFDAILAKHKGETNDEVANIAYMKAALYQSVFQQPDKAAEMFKQLQLDFPGTASAKKADQAIAGIKQGEEARKIQEALAIDSAFPDFDVKDLDGKPLKVANFKGKVVMIDFWATWCGPCVGEVPNVAAVYQKYHDKGFEIIGVSLDREGDKDKMISFTKEHNMPWPQFYDGKYWQNELSVKYGIRSIPATFLLDGSGKIIAKNVRGEALEPAVKKALGVN
jgi:thiol-disulfide isomerase/thioredoxin